MSLFVGYVDKGVTVTETGNSFQALHDNMVPSRLYDPVPSLVALVAKREY